MHRLTHTIVIVAVVALIRVHCGALELVGVISLHIPMHRLTQAVVIVVLLLLLPPRISGARTIGLQLPS
jgi:hypothetical protein